MGTCHHHIRPLDNQDITQPYISIINYSLIGCESGRLECSIDSAKKISVEKKFNNLQEHYNVDKNYTFLKNKEMKNLNTQAVIYETTNDFGGTEVIYLFKVTDGVLNITFHDSKEFGNAFMAEFIERIK